MTEKEFNSSVMPPIQFSLAISKIATGKAVNENVQEFVGFEIMEGTAITRVLRDFGTVIADMTEEEQTILSEITATETGIDFDKRYIKAELQNHRFLRDLTEDYLSEAPVEHLDPEESQYKHLAILMLTMFIEHVTILEGISTQLGSDTEPSSAGNNNIATAEI